MSPDEPGKGHVPRAPRGLSTRGRAFWRAAWERFEFEDHERQVLVETCRQLDLCEELQAALAVGPVVSGRLNPAVNAVRTARAELRALLAALDWPETAEVASGRHTAATKAARARWLPVVAGGEAEP